MSKVFPWSENLLDAAMINFMGKIQITEEIRRAATQIWEQRIRRKYGISQIFV